MLAVLAGLTAIVPLHHDLWRSYITTSDADIIFVVEGMLLNDWLPQWQFDHPGYVYDLLLGLWFQILHLIGVLKLTGFSKIVQLPADHATEAYAHLVVAGRILSIVVSAVFVIAMFLTLRAMTRQTAVAMLCAVVFAFGIGIADQSIILRTELLSSLFLFFGFAAFIGARHSSEGRCETLLAAAGFFSVMALATKVQAIFLLLGFPALAIAFGDRAPPSAGLAGEKERGFASLLLGLAAGAVGLPAAAMILRAIQFKNGSGGYQLAILGYVILSMIVYAALYRIPWRRSLNGMAALSIGVSLAFFFHFVHHNLNNVMAVVDFVEQMAPHSREFATGGGAPQSSAIAMAILDSSAHVIQSRGLVEELGRHPIRLIEWSVFLGSLYAIWTGLWRLGVQCLMLLGAALSAEAVFGLRWFRNDYQIYTDPWVMIAAALLLAAGLTRARNHVTAVKITALAIAGIVTVTSLAQSWAYDFVPRQPDSNACYQTSQMAPEIALQFKIYCR